MNHKFNFTMLIAVIYASLLFCISTSAMKPVNDPPALVWKIKLANYTYLKPIDASNDYIAISTEVAGPIAIRNGLVLLNSSTGNTAWAFDTYSYTKAAIHNKYLYLVYGDTSNPFINAFDISAKHHLWTLSASSINRETAFGKSSVFFSDNSGDLVAADLITGKALWWVKPDSIVPTGLFSSTKKIIPMAASTDYVYSKLDDEKFGVQSDISTGKTNHTIQIIPGESSLFTMFRMEWSQENNILLYSGGNIGAGVESFVAGALYSDMKPVWSRWNTGVNELVDNVLVAENYTQPYKRAGIVGLNPQTGKELWKRSYGEQKVEEIIGKLGRYAVVKRSEKTGKKITSYNLIGIRPKDGLQAWMINIPLMSEAKAFDDILVISSPKINGRSLALVRAYKPKFND